MPTRAQMSEAEKYAKDHTALMREALEGHTEAVKALLGQGTDVNAKDDEGRTALMFASINAHTETVKALLEHGADVNVRASDGGTALMLAAVCGEVNIVRALLNKGAGVTGQFTHTGKTALKLAEERGYTDIVELLKGAGAKR
jgi:ankyrin repeat protein